MHRLTLALPLLLVGCADSGISTEELLAGAQRDAASYSFESVTLQGPDTVAFQVDDIVLEFNEGESIKVTSLEDTGDVRLPGFALAYEDADEGQFINIMRISGQEAYFRDMDHFLEEFSVGPRDFMGSVGFTFSLHLDPTGASDDRDYFLADRVRNLQAGAHFTITDVEQPDPSAMELRVRAEFSGILVDGASGEEAFIEHAVVVGNLRGNDCADRPGTEFFARCDVEGFETIPSDITSEGPGTAEEEIGGVPTPVREWLQSLDWLSWNQMNEELRRMQPDGDTSPPHNSYRFFYNNTLFDALEAGEEPPVGSAAVVGRGDLDEPDNYVPDSYQIMVRVADSNDDFDWWYGTSSESYVPPGLGNDAPGSAPDQLDVIVGGRDSNFDTVVGTCFACHGGGVGGGILGIPD